MEISVKSYGKILVFGSYSILEPGNIGLVVNIDKGTTTTVQEIKSGRIVIDLSDFQINVYGVIEGGKLKLKKDNPVLKFIKNAVESSFIYLNHKGVKLRDVRVITYNDPELYIKKKLKSGFGSSATATVSTVAAILKLHEIEDPDLVYKISLYSHLKSQGFKGSGFDISAACYGSHFFMSEKYEHMDDFSKFINSERGVLRESFEWPGNLYPIIVFTGKSASTEEFIGKIEEYKYREPQSYKELMQEYNQVNLSLKQAFEENWVKRIRYFLEKSWSYRKKLGKLAGVEIEPEKITAIIDEMKKNGAYTAGLVGAGGGDSILAISNTKEEKDLLIDFLKKKHLKIFEDINITNREYELLK